HWRWPKTEQAPTLQAQKPLSFQSPCEIVQSTAQNVQQYSGQKLTNVATAAYAPCVGHREIRRV
ncbi:MAG: hypothetical protein O7B25_09105, partial [Gammaproteobacteria bacterium]|nr:hypothetical protein [Gammaproteobacteria bacterium]